ncbi:hypothetical protein [Bradyrhizobium sp. SBR1B]|uniref:hypothetical protein n=1 Tax=Bradyrhizobium sp. SBR1B TaxID=2663836 RepID=UPI0016058AA1|nr:hypothetical protein [Bradyrhizobium sp. SBR1B]MBB4383012.1 hypothetical protein [Bradyrhizobium sp. SBR1B]
MDGGVLIAVVFAGNHHAELVLSLKKDDWHHLPMASRTSNESGNFAGQPPIGQIDIRFGQKGRRLFSRSIRPACIRETNHVRFGLHASGGLGPLRVRDGSPQGARRRGVEKKGVFERMEPAGYASYLPGLPVSETTETSKGERDQSMPGNVSKSGAAARWRVHSKGMHGESCIA